MKVTDFCKSYFNGFQDASNYKKNDTKTNVLAAVKILSYFTVVIPLGFAAVYGATSLYGRVSKKELLSSQDKSVNNQAKKTLDITPFLTQAKNYAKTRSNCESVDLLSYIKRILNDSGFQTDPEKFMANWKVKRGGTEEFRMLEDSAMAFFQQQVLPKGLLRNPI